MMDILRCSKNIFYLESIERNMKHLIDIMNNDDTVMKPGIQYEATCDNLDWLQCYIEELKKEQVDASTTTKTGLEGQPPAG